MSARKAAAGDGPYPLPDGWRWVKLGDLISASGSRVGDREDIPVYSVTKHSGFVPSEEYFTKQVHGRDISKYKVVEPGEFAYATIHLDEGSIGVAPVRAAISPMYTVFTSNEELVDTRYLIRFLKSDWALSAYRNIGQGAVHRRKSISLSALSEVNFPLPPLTEQRRIAEIIEKAKFICVKEDGFLQGLSGLAGAEFDRRFGGLQNRMVRLGDVVLGIDSGKSPKCESFPADSGNWGVLKLSAVTGGTYRPSENKAIFDRGSIDQKNEVGVGDVLMTRKNTPELVGEVCYVSETPERMLIPDLVFRVRLDDEKISGKFFQVMMMRPVVRERVRSLAGGSAKSMSNISKSRLADLAISLPPLTEQQKFESFLDRLEGVKSKSITAASMARDLFSSLQSRAFRGEL